MDFLQLGKDPINSNKPAGSDIRYEPEFEQLQAEIDKLASLSATSGVNWAKVADLSSKILAEKSKDLLVASYFAVSQVHAHQLEGLPNGVTVMHDLVANFWDNLFPAKKRMRGRLGAFEWWLEKTLAALENLNARPLAPEIFEAMKTDLDQLDTLLNEHMSEPPMLIKLRRYIEGIPSTGTEERGSGEGQASSPDPVEAKIAETPKPPSAKPASAPVVETPPETESDANVLISSGLKYLSKAVDVLNSQDWRDARAYRIRRQAAWLNIEDLPTDSEGKTMLPPPPLTTAQALQNTYTNGEWSELLKGAEANISPFIFWLDLNRMVAAALAGLGHEYQAACDTVCWETAFFVHRFPGLTKLTFATGVPFADPETVAWLKGISLGGGSMMNASVTMASYDQPADDQNRMTETLQKAQDLVKKKKIVDAVALLEEEMQSAHSGKDSLMWRMSLCQILVAAKRAPLAIPHLELILEKIDEFQLEAWDPDLTLKALKMVWQGFKAQNDKTVKEQAGVILSRINRISPTVALGLK